MTERKPETSRRAVIENVDRETVEADHFGEAFDHAREIVERVTEAFARRHVGLAEAGKVGRHDMKPVRQQRDEVTKHVACAGEAVQQQEFWRSDTTGLAIEPLEALDIRGAVRDCGHDILHLSNH